MRQDYRTTGNDPKIATSSRPLSEAEWRSAVRAMKLSPRQAAIVGLILEGKRDKQIAQELKISFWTVRTHLTRIFARVGVADRMELVLRIAADAHAAMSKRLHRNH